MDPRARALSVIVLCAGGAGCATDDGPGGVPPPPAADAAPFVCDPVPPLELGGCAVADGGACRGAANEAGHYVPLAEGGQLTVVMGPQGASMLVFSLRTTGIVPGDPAQPASAANPLADVRVIDEHDIVVGRYRGRLAFTDGGGGQLDAPGVFVIVDGPGGTLEHRALTAQGEVVDSAGVRRCGSRAFTATQ